MMRNVTIQEMAYEARRNVMDFDSARKAALLEEAERLLGVSAIRVLSFRTNPANTHTCRAVVYYLVGSLRETARWFGVTQNAIRLSVAEHEANLS